MEDQCENCLERLGEKGQWRVINHWKSYIREIDNRMSWFSITSMEERTYWKWSKDKNGKFSVNSAYKELNSVVVKERDWPLEAKDSLQSKLFHLVFGKRGSRES